MSVWFYYAIRSHSGTQRARDRLHRPVDTLRIPVSVQRREREPTV